jgi:hypothetical protein
MNWVSSGILPASLAASSALLETRAPPPMPAPTRISVATTAAGMLKRWPSRISGISVKASSAAAITGTKNSFPRSRIQIDAASARMVRDARIGTVALQ